jgi:hypothetical protein
VHSIAFSAKFPTGFDGPPPPVLVPWLPSIMGRALGS